MRRQGLAGYSTAEVVEADTLLVRLWQVRLVAAEVLWTQVVPLAWRRAPAAALSKTFVALPRLRGAAAALLDSDQEASCYIFCSGLVYVI